MASKKQPPNGKKTSGPAPHVAAPVAPLERPTEEKVSSPQTPAKNGPTGTSATHDHTQGSCPHNWQPVEFIARGEGMAPTPSGMLDQFGVSFRRATSIVVSKFLCVRCGKVEKVNLSKLGHPNDGS